METEVLTDEQVAGTTTEESSTSPEVPPANTTEAEKTEETPKPSSQQTAPTGDKGKESEKRDPWHNDPRFREFNADYKEWKKSRPVLEALAEKGITDLDAADTLIAELEHAKKDSQTLQSVLHLIHNDQAGLLAEIERVAPQSAQALKSVIGEQSVTNFLEKQISDYRRLGMETEAEFLEKLKPKGTAAPAQQTAQQQRTDPSRENWQRERQEEFNNRVEEEVDTRVRKRVDGITAKVHFQDDEQRADFHDKVARELTRVYQSDAVFKTKIARLSSDGSRDREHRDKLAAEFERRALAAGTLERIVQKALRTFGLASNGNVDAAARAAERKDVPAGGTAAPGAVETIDRDATIAKAEADFRAGKITHDKLVDIKLSLPARRK